MDAKIGRRGTVRRMRLHVMPPTRDIALVALGACVDLSGKTVRSGCDWLTHGEYKNATLETLAKLRLWMPLMAVLLMAVMGVGIGLAVTVSPIGGTVVIIAGLAAPYVAALKVRRKASEVAQAPRPDADGVVL